jgi:hypothetical protein
MNTVFGKRTVILLVFLTLLILGPYGDSRDEGGKDDHRQEWKSFHVFLKTCSIPHFSGRPSHF